MTEIGDLLAVLGTDATDGYELRPIPHEIDDDVRSLIEAISQADAALRSTILSLMKVRHGHVLSSFAARMAAMAVRTKDTRYLTEALTALALANQLCDWRDVLQVVSLVFRSVDILGGDARSVLTPPGVSDAEFERIFRNFLRRTPMQRDIKDMGYAESEDEGGFRYQAD